MNLEKYYTVEPFKEKKENKQASAFLEKMKAKSDGCPTIEQTVKEDSSALDDEFYKKRVKELEKMLDKTKKELKTKNDDLSDAKKQIRSLKNERHEKDLNWKKRESELLFENAFLSEQVSSISSENTKLLLTNQQQEVQIEHLKNQLRDFNGMKKGFGKLTNRNNRLSKNIEHLTSQTKDLQNVISNKNERIAELIRKSSGLQAQLDAMTIEKMVSLLCDHLNEKNVNKFQKSVEPLLKKIESLMKKETSKKSKAQTSPIFLFGCIQMTEERLIFKTENGETLPLHDSSFRIEIDQPAKGVVIDSKVRVIRYYQDGESPLSTSVKKKVKRQTKYREKLQFPEFLSEDLKVLIIGSRFQKAYTDYLKLHGITAVWHNPHEESYERMHAKINQCKIVIICRGHVPHAVFDHFDESNSKFQVMDADSRTKLLARIRYAAINFGHIKKEKTA